jgi:hypothetical protein
MAQRQFSKKTIRKKSLDANRHNRKKYYEHMLAQRFVHVQAKYAMYTCVYVCPVYGTVRTYSCPLGDFSLSDTGSRFLIENTEPVNPSGQRIGPTRRLTHGFESASVLVRLGLCGLHINKIMSPD